MESGSGYHPGITVHNFTVTPLIISFKTPRLAHAPQARRTPGRTIPSSALARKVGGAIVTAPPRRGSGIHRRAEIISSSATKCSSWFPVTPNVAFGYEKGDVAKDSEGSGKTSNVLPEISRGC